MTSRIRAFTRLPCGILFSLQTVACGQRRLSYRASVSSGQRGLTTWPCPFPNRGHHGKHPHCRHHDRSRRSTHHRQGVPRCAPLYSTWGDHPRTSRAMPYVENELQRKAMRVPDSPNARHATLRSPEPSEPSRSSPCMSGCCIRTSVPWKQSSFTMAPSSFLSRIDWQRV
jgi:hypothetical protein